jgi:DNA-directed RNA polymerase subunit RPC12/RpoP
MTDAPEIRCTRCRAEFTRAETSGVSACPSCGTRGLPMDVAEDVEIRINWHELRILTIWASNYAQQANLERASREALAAILHALALQHPKLSERSPLTLFGEVEQLRRAIESGEIPAAGLETNIRDILDDEE